VGCGSREASREAVCGHMSLRVTADDSREPRKRQDDANPDPNPNPNPNLELRKGQAALTLSPSLTLALRKGHADGWWRCFCGEPRGWSQV